MVPTVKSSIRLTSCMVPTVIFLVRLTSCMVPMGQNLVSHITVMKQLTLVPVRTLLVLIMIQIMKQVVLVLVHTLLDNEAGVVEIMTRVSSGLRLSVLFLCLV